MLMPRLQSSGAIPGQDDGLRFYSKQFIKEFAGTYLHRVEAHHILSILREL